MRKPPFYKSWLCESCEHFVPQRDLSDTTIIGASHWKEACRLTGHAFFPMGKKADVCFNFQCATGEEGMMDFNLKDLWAKEHLCHKCAFWEDNGMPYLDCKDKKRKAVWERFHRCHGYLHLSSDEYVCSTYLTLEQWKEVESTPMEGFARGEKCSLFRKINAENHV